MPRNAPLHRNYTWVSSLSSQRSTMNRTPRTRWYWAVIRLFLSNQRTWHAASPLLPLVSTRSYTYRWCRKMHRWILFFIQRSKKRA